MSGMQSGGGGWSAGKHRKGGARYNSRARRSRGSYRGVLQAIALAAHGEWKRQHRGAKNAEATIVVVIGYTPRRKARIPGTKEER